MKRLLVAAVLLLLFLLHPPASPVAAQTAPTKVCTPTTPAAVSGTTSCVMTLTSTVPAGGVIIDTVTSPAGATATCGIATGGLTCIPPPSPGASVTLTCNPTAPATNCPASTTNYQISIASPNVGALTESVAVTPPGGGAPVPFAVTPSPAVTFVSPGVAEPPTETCNPTNPSTGASTTCTLTTASTIASGGFVILSVTGPSGATITNCTNAMGGLACGASGSGSITLICTPTAPATSCAAGATVSLSITATGTGALSESASVTPPGGGTPSTFAVAPSPPVTFGAAPTKACTVTTVQTGGSTVCTVTLNSAVPDGTSVADSVGNPSGATITNCAVGAGSGLSCGVTGLATITLSCGTAPTCPATANFTLTITATGAGPLTETVVTTPPGGGGATYTVTPVPPVTFSSPPPLPALLPSKVCSVAGLTATCNITLVSPLTAAGYLIDTVVNLPGAAITGCTATGGLVCAAPVGASVTVTCAPISPATTCPPPPPPPPGMATPGTITLTIQSTGGGTLDESVGIAPVGGTPTIFYYPNATYPSTVVFTLPAQAPIKTCTPTNPAPGGSTACTLTLVTPLPAGGTVIDSVTGLPGATIACGALVGGLTCTTTAAPPTVTLTCTAVGGCPGLTTVTTGGTPSSFGVTVTSPSSGALIETVSVTPPGGGTPLTFLVTPATPVVFGTITGVNPPFKTCTPTNPVSNTTTGTTCTITTASDISAGGYIVDTVTGVPGGTITACTTALGGLACQTPTGNSVTVTCSPPATAATCASGASFQVTITATGAGTLNESIAITPSAGGTPVPFSVSPTPPVVFVTGPMLPTKSCTVTNPTTAPPGNSTNCTLTLTSPVPLGGSIVDSVSSPAGVTLSTCTTSTGSGLVCGTIAGASITIGCPAAGGCPAGGSFTVTVTATASGPLLETVSITPGNGGPPQTFYVVPVPPVSFGATIPSPPLKNCTDANPVAGGSTVCTLSLTSPVLAGGTLTDTVTGPAGGTITVCTPGTTSIITCSSPVPATSVTLTCGIGGCNVGATVNLTITATGSGSLTETAAVPPPQGGPSMNFPLIPTPPVVFGGTPSPTKTCTVASPPVNSSTNCTVTLASAMTTGGTVVDTVTAPIGATLSGCTATGGLVCGTAGGTSAALTCTPLAPATTCAAGASFTVTITSTTPGALAESAVVTPSAGGTPATFAVVPVPPVTFTGATFTGPTKSCTVTNPAPGASTTCTITTTAAIPAAGTLVDTVTGPTGVTLSACTATGGLVCGVVAGASATLTCTPVAPATTCAAGSTFSVTVTATGSGALTESIAETPPGGGAPATFAVTPVPPVSFGGAGAPTKSCTNTSPPLGGSTTCTLTLTSPIANTGTLTDTITSPSGATITSCTAGAGSGLTCGTPTGPTVMLTCGASSCGTGATFSIVVTASGAGTLKESVALSGVTTPFIVTANPPVMFGGVGTPTKACTPTNPAISSSTVCTITLASSVPAGGVITDTVTGPAGMAITACMGTTTLVCGAAGGTTASVTCTPAAPATSCAAGSSFSLTIKATGAGPLTESISVPPSVGGAPVTLALTPTPAVSFGTPFAPVTSATPLIPLTQTAPTVTCGSVQPLPQFEGYATSCTVTLTSTLGAGGSLQISITGSPALFIADCQNGSGGLTCGQQLENSVVLNCNVPSAGVTPPNSQGPAPCVSGAEDSVSFGMPTPMSALNLVIGITPAQGEGQTQSFNVTVPLAGSLPITPTNLVRPRRVS